MRIQSTFVYQDEESTDLGTDVLTDNTLIGSTSDDSAILIGLDQPSNSIGSQQTNDAQSQAASMNLIGELSDCGLLIGQENGAQNLIDGGEGFSDWLGDSSRQAEPNSLIDIN